MKKIPLPYLLKLYFSTLLIFLAIDMIWLVVISRAFYARHLGYLMAPALNWYAALAFYVLFVFALLVFVILPGLKEKNLPLMLAKAALFGLVTYATYDLTNLATVRDWPLVVTLADLAWGMILTTTVSLAGFFAGKRMA